MDPISVARAGEMPGPIGAFIAYWDSLPKKGLLPQLSDFFDSVPPDLAPYMAIVDIQAPDMAKIRFFGTQLVDSAAFDPTGMTVADLYDATLRPQVHAMLWACSRKPAGYLSRRKIIGRSGYVNIHPSVGLPIEIPTSGVRGVVNYSRSAGGAGHVVEDRASLVQEMKLERWIDLGAGVPG
jgi:hypothetical protein